NSRSNVGSERRSGGEIRHDCSDPATVIYQSRLRDVIASLRQPTQSKHVVVTKDVRVGSVCHQRPECSTTTESPGDIVDVAAGDAEMHVTSLMVGPAIRRAFTNQLW